MLALRPRNTGDGRRVRTGEPPRDQAKASQFGSLQMGERSDAITNIFYDTLVTDAFAAATVPAFLVPPCSSATEIDAPRLFSDLNANRDGHDDAPAGDAARSPAARVHREDDDSDGRLTADELAAELTPQRRDVEQGSRLAGQRRPYRDGGQLDASGDPLRSNEIPAIAASSRRSPTRRRRQKRPPRRRARQQGPQLGGRRDRRGRLEIDVPAELARCRRRQARRWGLPDMVNLSDPSGG